MTIDFLASIFIAICFFGFYLAYLYGHKTKNFRWNEYFAIIILPILCVVMMAIFVDIKILNLFIISSFTGFFLEYVVGLTYHKTLNRRLWEYKKFSINGYTSYLSIPIWGIGGVFFWFIAKMLNL